MKMRSLAWLLACTVAPAGADTFTVSRTDDPLPDACAPGDCSLREAMQAANSNDAFAETDRIVLGPGTHVLVRGNLPTVTQSLDIDGAGSETTRVESDADLFALGGSTSREMRLRGMTLDASTEFTSAALVSKGLLAADDVVVVRGSVNIGGDGSLHVVDSVLGERVLCNTSASCTIEDSILATFNVNPPGDTAQPETVLRRCVVDGDLWPDSMLTGIVVHHGTTLLEDTTLTHLDSGIKPMNADASITLRRVRYVDNHEPVRTEVAATITIEDSVFEDNLVRALYAAGGAEWTVTGSTFLRNRVDGNAGGAIVLEDDTELRIRNSTFSANTFTTEAAADGARGAAIGYRNGSGAQLILQHVTIVRPVGLPIGTLGSAVGGLGGSVAVDISNSILNGTCGFEVAVLQNNAGNIEVPGASCGLDDEANQSNVSPAELALGTLGEHGGPTPTYLPADASNAIDRGSPPQCLDGDQRGYGRPVGRAATSGRWRWARRRPTRSSCATVSNPDGSRASRCTAHGGASAAIVCLPSVANRRRRST